MHLFDLPLTLQILLTEEFVEQMLGDLQELNTREEVSKIPCILTFVFSFVLFYCLPVLPCISFLFV